MDPCFYYLCLMIVFAMLSCLLLAALCVVFSFVFVTFPYGVEGQVWYLIIAIPDLCLPLYSEYFAVTGNVSATCFSWSDLRNFPDDHKKLMLRL